VDALDKWGDVEGVGDAKFEGVASGEDGSVISGWRVVVDETLEYDSLLERDEAREVVLEVGEWRLGGWR
jgi:hypothetical protein